MSPLNSKTVYTLCEFIDHVSADIYKRVFLQFYCYLSPTIYHLHIPGTEAVSI